MDDALGMLVVAFAVMSAISLVGIILMFRLQSQNARTAVLCGMSAFGVLLAGLYLSSLPTNFTDERMLAWCVGGLSVLGLVVQLCGKGSKRASLLARLLVSAMVTLGIIALFWL